MTRETRMERRHSGGTALDAPAATRRGYAHPEALVGTAWVAEHLHDPTVRLVEVDVDTGAYREGHIEGAVGWSWTKDLCDPVVRDIIPARDLAALLGRSGIANDTTVVLYGDNNNWFAAWAFWQLKLYRHADVRLMNGGRKKWVAEGRPLRTDVPTYLGATYRVPDPDFSIRARLPEVEASLGREEIALVDVRGPQEFTGELLSPPGLAETCQRGGHIPGAVNVPWGRACNEDGTFRSWEELRQLYADAGVPFGKRVITYCRIGERSSHTWFALTYLLGFGDVRNYDGSWTEWGNLVGARVEVGS